MVYITYEGLKTLRDNDKLRKIGRLLGTMAKENLICKTDKGKKWNITEKGESELGI